MAQQEVGEQRLIKSAKAQRATSPGYPSALHPPAPSSSLSHVAIQRSLANPRALAPTDILQLQRTVGNHAVQRLLNAQTEPLLQRNPQNGFEAGNDFERDLSRTKGRGSPLPKQTRSEFEQSFGTSLGNVRIHTGADSNQLNRSIQAKAFTHGNDIHFSAGQYNPASSQGKHLLAHELTHTIQQSGGAPTKSVQPKLQVGPANDRHEQEADRVATQVVQPRAVPQSQALNTSRPSQESVQPRIQRKWGLGQSKSLKDNSKDQSNGAQTPATPDRTYLNDGGTKRWRKDTNFGPFKNMSPIDMDLMLYRQYKSKNLGNAEEQAHLLFGLKNSIATSSYQSGINKQTSTFMKRQAATTALKAEVDRELRTNPDRLKKVASEAEQIKELAKVGFSKEFFAHIHPKERQLLYSAHASLAHHQLDSAQNALDLLNPVERNSTGALQYSNEYLKRSSSELHFAQQMLTAHHHAAIGGEYGRTFAPQAMDANKLGKVTNKYLRNANFLGQGTIDGVKDKGAGYGDLNEIVRDNPTLTPQEIEAIRIYSGGTYKQLNATMHDVRLDNPKEQKNFKGYSAINQLALSGLNKLPSYGGQEVYRGDHNFGGLLNTARPGTTFLTPSFMSSSKAKHVATNFGGLVGWRIKTASNSRGKDIEHIATAGDREKEVLFPPGTKLKVVDSLFRDSDHDLGDGPTVAKFIDGESKADRVKRIWHSESGKAISPNDYEYLYSCAQNRRRVLLVQEL